MYVYNADYQYERYYNWDPVTGDTEEKGYSSKEEGYYWNDYAAASNLFLEEYDTV